MSGLESGGINLQSVRHDEGKQITCLRGHASAVSVLNLSQKEDSVLSGSWDKKVLDWDLNTGKVIRQFEDSGGQISALETRPLSNLPVPESSGDILAMVETLWTDSADKPQANGASTDDTKSDIQNEFTSREPVINGVVGSPADSLFGGNDGDSLFGDSEAPGAPSGGNFVDDDDDDFSRAIANGMREQEQEQEQEREHNQERAYQNLEGDVQMKDAGEASPTAAISGDTQKPDLAESGVHEDQTASQEAQSSPQRPTNGFPHAEELLTKGSNRERVSPAATEAPPTSDSTFLAAAFDGSLRVWDKRQSKPVAKIIPQNVPPWCMNACWSPDGNFIYAGRRNGTVDEYSLHKGLRAAERSFKLPNNSGPVSAVRAMPNGRHLIWYVFLTAEEPRLIVRSASYDILRLYDLQQQQIFKHATVPFLIVPGHRTGVVSHLYMDPTCRYLISTAGNRGWEGSSTEVLLGYEIGVPK